MICSLQAKDSRKPLVEFQSEPKCLRNKGSQWYKTSSESEGPRMRNTNVQQQVKVYCKLKESKLTLPQRFLGIFNDWNKTDLKAQLLEEPFILAGFVSFLKLDLDLLLGHTFKSRVSEDILISNSFFQGDTYRVPCGLEVIYFKLQSFTKDLLSDLLAICFLPVVAFTLYLASKVARS